jgi:hypothetical protein
VRVIPYDQEQEALALLKERLYRATTPEQREAVELLLEQLYRDRDASIAAARKSLIAFGVRCVPKWRPEWFHVHLGGRLQRLIEGIAKQETITSEIAIAPPRHGKSLLLPTPLLLGEVVAAIPRGRVMTIGQLRRALAELT